MKAIRGLAEIISEYDGFIVDAWGVLHDGMRPFKNVLKTLRCLKDLGKTVIISTNSPSRKEKVKLDLEARGINQDLYSDVASSGELAFYAIQQMIVKSAGQIKCFFLGQKKHFLMIDGLNLQSLPIIQEGAFLLNTGPFDPSDCVESYRDLLSTARGYSAQMLCVNPDQFALFQGKSCICAGAIAKLYEAIGGKVTYFGKPYVHMYEYIMSLFPVKSRLVVIGDSLETDIRGGINAGIDTVLVFTGITPPGTCFPVQPTYCMKQLQW